MSDFEISDNSRKRAYKELIQELEDELKNKPIQIENLEVEYFKKYLFISLCKEESEKEKLRKESDELEEKIKNEMNLHVTLGDKINALKANYGYKFKD